MTSYRRGGDPRLERDLKKVNLSVARPGYAIDWKSLPYKSILGALAGTMVLWGVIYLIALGVGSLANASRPQIVEVMDAAGSVGGPRLP